MYDFKDYHHIHNVLQFITMHKSLRYKLKDYQHYVFQFVRICRMFIIIKSSKNHQCKQLVTIFTKKLNQSFYSTLPNVALAWPVARSAALWALCLWSQLCRSKLALKKVSKQKAKKVLVSKPAHGRVFEFNCKFNNTRKNIICIVSAKICAVYAWSFYL